MQNKTKQSFEQAIDRLEEIVILLEKGKCKLADAMKLFDEGVALSLLCEQQLNDARALSEKLTNSIKENTHEPI